MADGDQKRACLVYVASTAGQREAVRKELEAKGYVVCETEAGLGEAKTVQAGLPPLSEALKGCLAAAELCVFLLPEDPKDDAEIGLAADAADRDEKRLIGIVAGGRTTYPDVLDEGAESMLRAGSQRLGAALAGEPTWEGPDGASAPPRPIKRVRCQ